MHAKTCEAIIYINKISVIFPMAKFFLLMIGKTSKNFDILVTLINCNRIKAQCELYYFILKIEKIIENGIIYKK